MTGESWIWTGFLNRTVNIGSKPVRYQVYVRRRG